MRRRARVDGNHAEVVAMLRAFGASVQSLAPVGDGCPDLLVGWHGVTELAEVKDGADKKLRAKQVTWHRNWRGRPVRVIRSVEEARAWAEETWRQK